MKRLAILSLGLAAVLVQPACTSTVTPDQVGSSQASFDEGQQTSGVIRLTATGAVITKRAVARYNALAEIYGRAWLPAIAPGYGLTDLGDGTWLITNDALEKFIVMSEWRRMGRKAS